MQRARARVGALLTTSLRSPLQRRLGCVPTNTDSLQEENQQAPEEGSSMGKPAVLKTEIGLMYDENGSDCDDKTRKRLIKNRKSAKLVRERKVAYTKSLEREIEELREHVQCMTADMENVLALMAANGISLVRPGIPSVTPNDLDMPPATWTSDDWAAMTLNPTYLLDDATAAGGDDIVLHVLTMMEGMDLDDDDTGAAMTT